MLGHLAFVGPTQHVGMAPIRFRSRGMVNKMKIRLMRGQVVVREVRPVTGSLWTPTPAQREQKTHMGEVLAMGPPSRLTDHPDSPEVPHGFKVGDVVQFHFGAMGTQESRTRLWTDEEPATWLTQAEIDGVWFDARTM